MTHKRTIIPVLAAVLLPVGLAAQDTLHLTLDDAVRRAVTGSDEARIAAAQVQLADAQITAARSIGLPQLRVSSGYNQIIESSRARVVNAILTQPYTYSSSAVLSQVLFQGGRFFAGSRAAGETREAAQFSQRDVRDRLSVTAQRLYLQAVLARQLVEIQEHAVTLADGRVKQIEQLEKAGRAARFDVLRSRVDRANLEPALLQARSNKELADIALRQLLSLPREQTLDLTVSLDTAQLHASIANMPTDSGLALARPSVRAAESNAEARRQAVKVSLADYLPTITTSLTSGYTALPASAGFPTRLGQTGAQFCAPDAPANRVCQNNGWFPDRSFNVQFTWNLFDGLRTKGNVEQARSQARLADLQANQARRQAETESAAAGAEFTRARAAFEAQRENATEAEEAYSIATLRFDRGLSTLLEVTDAQNALLTAQVNAARASVDLFVAVAELARANGREIPLAPTRPNTR